MISQQEFQKRHSAQLRAIIESPLGKDLFDLLTTLRPPLTPHNVPHLHSEASGAARGYELCMRHIVTNAFPLLPQETVKQDYGVKESKT